jgi:hypothetical protein
LANPRRPLDHGAGICSVGSQDLPQGRNQKLNGFRMKEDATMPLAHGSRRSIATVSPYRNLRVPQGHVQPSSGVGADGRLFRLAFDLAWLVNIWVAYFRAGREISDHRARNLHGISVATRCGAIAGDLYQPSPSSLGVDTNGKCVDRPASRIRRRYLCCHSWPVRRPPLRPALPALPAAPLLPSNPSY